MPLPQQQLQQQQQQQQQIQLQQQQQQQQSVSQEDYNNDDISNIFDKIAEIMADKGNGFGDRYGGPSNPANEKQMIDQIASQLMGEEPLMAQPQGRGGLEGGRPNMEVSIFWKKLKTKATKTLFTFF